MAEPKEESVLVALKEIAALESDRMAEEAAVRRARETELRAKEARERALEEASRRAAEEEARRKMLSHLQGRQLLLILDNFEHILEAGNIRLVLDMIKAAPQSKVLVTSRERLNIHGETIFRLEGQDVPVEDAAFSLTPETIPPEGFSALELFEQSARRVEPSFRITHENYKVISDRHEISP